VQLIDIAHNMDIVKILSQKSLVQITSQEIVMNQLMFMVQVDVCKTTKIALKEKNVLKVFVISHHQIVLNQELLVVKKLTHVSEVSNVNQEDIATISLKNVF